MPKVPLMTSSPAPDTTGQIVTLAPLVALLAGDMAKVNEQIVARLAADVPLIPELAGHLIAAGGKRIRPMMTLAGARLGGGDDRAVGLATAVEFIHTATLLHDDVIDESALRRGRDTANALWGNEASVLVGDFLFARAFELMVEAGDIRVLGRLATASANITQGELKQLQTAGAPDTTAAAYIDVITGKTAELFAAAAAAGAEIAGATPAEVSAMQAYGMKLGLAFQVMDDAMDYAVSTDSMGKNAGDDFFDQKVTLPVILAWQDGTEDERGFWRRTMQDGQFTDGDLDTAKTILTRHQAIDRAMQVASDYAAAAIAALDPIATADPARTTLIGALAAAARFAAARQN